MFDWEPNKMFSDRPAIKTQSFSVFGRVSGLSAASLRIRATIGDMTKTTELAVGWPMPALLGVADSGSRGSGLEVSPSPYPWQITPPKPRDWTKPYAKSVPMQPIWRGFAVNTLLYAFLFALFAFGPSLFRARRHSRNRNRGRCPKCGYDLLGNFADGCPASGWGK